MSEQKGSIYDILKSEHNWVKQTFKQIIEERDMALFSQTLGPLTKHMSGEEALFYPKLEANPGTKVLALTLRGTQRRERLGGQDKVCPG